MPPVRKGISKKDRFAIFARDKFTCRYCGSTSDMAILVVDHITPVKDGGTNDPANLITACEPCNQGKGGRSPDQAAPTAVDLERLKQDRDEQIATFLVAADAAEARSNFRQVVINVWCEIRKQESVNSATIGVMISFAKQYGIEAVSDWIQKAHDRWPSGSDTKVGRYVCGIRRRMVEQGELHG